MAFKWTEGDHRSGNILDVEEFNTSFNAFKGEINGGLDRENLPNGSVSNQELASNAMVKYVVVPNIRAQDTVTANLSWDRDVSGAGSVLTQPIKAITHNNYGGSWKTNPAYSINTLFQEGMLHLEFNCWYWTFNSTAGAAFLRTVEFQVLLDGAVVVRSGVHMQNVGQIHLVTDVPISTGNHKIEIRWRCSAFTSTAAGTNVVTISDPVFYYDGGQLTAINRYR
jgi:hypothetical protein